MRLRALILASVVALALPWASVRASDEKIVLEVLMIDRDPNKNIIQDFGDVSWTQILAEEFQKLYPHVEVRFVTGIGSLDQLAVLIAAGLGPDIIVDNGHKFMNLGYQGAFLDLKPLMAAEGWDPMADQTYWPRQYENYTYMGRQFAVPQYLGTTAMFYNVDMFRNAGIPEPDPRAAFNTMDWEEFRAIAKRLTRDANGDGVIDVWGFYKSMTRTDRIHYWMAAAGSDFFGNEARTVSTLNNPAAIAALDYLRELRWDDQVIPPPGVSADFLAGQVAILEAGSWNLVDYLGLKSDGSPKVPFSWNLFPMPIGPSGERGALATNDGYAINRNTKHPEEAYALLRFLSGPVGNEVIAKYLGLMPAHRDVIREYLDLMREVNRDVYDLNLFVLAEAGPYAYPEVVYADPMIGEAILKEIVVDVLDRNQPAGPKVAEAVSRLNRALALVGQGPARETVAWLGQEWVAEDINTALPGETRVVNGQLVVAGAGADIWSHRDGMRFVYQEVTGDFVATVRLHAAPSTNNWSKSGLMVRADVTPEAANVAVLGTHANGVVAQVRRAAGEPTEQTARHASWKNGNPIYLRMMRVGHRITVQISADGVSWTRLSEVEITLPDTVYVGIASTSHNAGTLGEAVFTEWDLRQ